MTTTTEALTALPAAAFRAELCRRSFADFTAWAWPLVTGAPFVGNTITERIVSTLQRVGDGELTRVLIACPPGVGKSTLLACYSAWRLARDAGHRGIHAGHSFELARDESLRVRRLVEGDAYRAAYPNVAMRDDQNTAGRWSTSQDGRYVAIGTNGGLTGIRAHEAVLDDPLNAIDRLSTAARETLWRWFIEALSTRLDGDRAPVTVVQQRLDRDDLIGRLIEVKGWHLVELPAETEDGELLAPNVLPREKLDALKAQSASTYACQYLQRPSDDSNATVKRTWWRFYTPDGVSPTTPRPAGTNADWASSSLPKLDTVVIAADLTFGSATGDFAVVQAWGRAGGARYLLEQWRRRAGFEESLVAIRMFAARWPRAKIIVEKAANGAAVIETLQKQIPNVVPKTPLGNKAQRLSSIAPTVESGSCYLPLGAPWLEDFVEELAGASKHDDSCDAAAYAVHELDSGGNVENARKLLGMGRMLLGVVHPWIDVPKQGATLEESLQNAKNHDAWTAFIRRGR